MKIYRTDLQRFEAERPIREKLSDLGVSGLGAPETPVEVTLLAAPRGDAYLLTGSARAHLVLTCDRCLGPATQEVAGTFRAWLVEEGGAAPTDGEDVVLMVPAHQPEVDLSGVIAEALYLELPPKTICRNDCRGLCPSCGTDWNQRQCDCLVQDMDERWSALLAVKEQLEI